MIAAISTTTTLDLEQVASLLERSPGWTLDMVAKGLLPAPASEAGQVYWERDIILPALRDYLTDEQFAAIDADHGTEQDHHEATQDTTRASTPARTTSPASAAAKDQQSKNAYRKPHQEHQDTATTTTPSTTTDNHTATTSAVLAFLDAAPGGIVARLFRTEGPAARICWPAPGPQRDACKELVRCLLPTSSRCRIITTDDNPSCLLDVRLPVAEKAPSLPVAAPRPVFLPVARPMPRCAVHVLQLLEETGRRLTGMALADELSRRGLEWSQRSIDNAVSYLMSEGKVDNARDQLGRGYGLVAWQDYDATTDQASDNRSDSQCPC